MKAIYIYSTALPGLSPDLDAHAERWIKSFVLDASPSDPVAGLETTPERSEALEFADVGEAMEFWRQQSKRDPFRHDGKPNRPLTLFTVSIE